MNARDYFRYPLQFLAGQIPTEEERIQDRIRITDPRTSGLDKFIGTVGQAVNLAPEALINTGVGLAFAPSRFSKLGQVVDAVSPVGTPGSPFNTRAQNDILVEQARRSGKAPLPSYMEPYISRRYTPAAKEQDVFESFLSPQKQAELRQSRTQTFTPEGVNTSKQLPGSGVASSVDDVAKEKASFLGKPLQNLKNNQKIVLDHVAGLTEGIIDPLRYPLTFSRKAKLIREQDEALKKAVNFTEDWYFNSDGSINNSVKKRMKDLSEDIKTKEVLDSYNRHTVSVDNPMEKPNKLASSRTKDLKTANISDYDKKYITKNRGRIAGVNTRDNSITLRNSGNYYMKPEKIAGTIVHENAHSAQKLGEAYDWDTHKWSKSWGEGATKYDEYYDYFTSDKSTEAGKEFAKHMVAPKRKGSSYSYQTWKSSPNELHADLMTARYNLVEKLSKNQTKEFRDNIINRLRDNPTDADIDLLLKDGLNKFFKRSTSKENKRKIIRMLPALLPAAMATGAAASSNEYQQGGNLNTFNYQENMLPLQTITEPQEVNGSVLRGIGAGAYGLAEGILDTVTFGLTDELTDKGFEGLQNLAKTPEEERRAQEGIKGITNTAGAAGAAIGASILAPQLAPKMFKSAISEGVEGTAGALGATNNEALGMAGEGLTTASNIAMPFINFRYGGSNPRIKEKPSEIFQSVQEVVPINPNWQNEYYHFDKNNARVWKTPKDRFNTFKQDVFPNRYSNIPELRKITTTFKKENNLKLMKVIIYLL
jgi:hypothetical protein